jgi:hypothetical protein
VDILKATYAKGSYDSVGEHIISTVEKMKKSIPALKYCQGEPFKEDHWTELLQGRLQLAKEVRIYICIYIYYIYIYVYIIHI